MTYGPYTWEKVNNTVDLFSKQMVQGSGIV